jgi:hypothetical protein
MVELKCFHCGADLNKSTGAINRARKINAKLFCNKVCFGLNRRLANPPTLQEKKETKRLYDANRRIVKSDEIKEKKAAYFAATYDPEVARIKRQLRMPQHVEYCRRPEYKKYKRQYDMNYRNKQDYGPYWESGVLLVALDKEISQRATYEELAQAKGTINKAQTRRREYEALISNKS